MKAKTDEMHLIFLLKKNIRTDIIKTILVYPLMTASKILREWKITITLVRQEYEFTKSQQDYRIGIGMTYGGRGTSMNIGKARENFNKDRKPQCFNYNIYGYMTKEFQKPKKEQNTRKCYKCDKVEHITKDCRLGQKMKNCSI